MSNNLHRTTARAYTLIEVLISLVLMTVVLGLILTAIDIYLRNMVVERMEVEEAQLARAVLEKIAKDVRSVVVAVQEETLEVDAEALALLFGFSSSYEMNLSSATTATTTTETSTETTTEESVSEKTTVSGTMPGIYGDLEWIQIDTTLLPRGEMYGAKQVRRSSSLMPDRLSSSKTILYYLGNETGQTDRLNEAQRQLEQLTDSLGRAVDYRGGRYGLVRRQMDRMVSQYTVNEGKEMEYEEYDELLAPEVAWMEFAYFDPTPTQQGGTGEWLEYWDMDEMQMLPTAIKITVGIQRRNFGNSFFANSWSQSSEQDSTIIYSLVVPIPITVDPPAASEEPQAL